jgi:hypothetical protein
MQELSEVQVDKLRLFLITDVKSSPCWFLQAARNPEEAIMKCINDKLCPISKDMESSCKAEEIRIAGYDIQVVPRDAS